VTTSVSDERIHSLVDGDIDAEERDRLFALAAADPELDRRIAEARRTKALVAHAYEVEVPAARVMPPHGARGLIAASLLAVAVVAAGVFATMMRDAGSPSRLAATAPAPVADGLGPGVVIQVADADPAKWRLAIEQARAVIAEKKSGKFDVVVIAYGPGLPMMQAKSAVLPELDASRAQGIRLLACGNTMEKQNVTAEQLAPGVQVAADGATIEIVHLQKLGYAYVRI
jgi:intracellular sulfur oxidation DsrE/DsrF family protein